MITYFCVITEGLMRYSRPFLPCSKFFWCGLHFSEFTKRINFFLFLKKDMANEAIKHCKEAIDITKDNPKAYYRLF